MADFDIASIDQNLAVATAVKAPDLKLYDVRKPPFQIYGLYEPLTEPVFKRMPTEVAETVNEGVKNLHLHTAGGRVRFSTDSPYIVIKVIMNKVTRFSHMPLTCSSAFDLYLDSPDGDSIHYRTFVPPVNMTDGYTSKIEIKMGGLRYFTINFPLYNDVKELYIGVTEGSTLGEGIPYRKEAPVVFYGSSITQGGCASHPGNCYSSIVCRALNIDHVNLGFSGNGLAEDTMVNYLKALDMSVFVCDYDHNAPNEAHLRATHQKMYDAIRAVKPELPYIMLSRPDYYYHNSLQGGHDSSVRRRQIILDTFHYAVAKGDKHVYFVDGESLFRTDGCTVDGVHPTDVGFYFMAQAVLPVVRRALLER